MKYLKVWLRFHFVNVNLFGRICSRSYLTLGFRKFEHRWITFLLYAPIFFSSEPLISAPLNYFNNKSVFVNSEYVRRTLEKDSLFNEIQIFALDQIICARLGYIVSLRIALVTLTLQVFSHLCTVAVTSKNSREMCFLTACI